MIRFWKGWTLGRIGPVAFAIALLAAMWALTVAQVHPVESRLGSTFLELDSSAVGSLLVDNTIPLEGYLGFSVELVDTMAGEADADSITGWIKPAVQNSRGTWVPVKTDSLNLGILTLNVGGGINSQPTVVNVNEVYQDSIASQRFDFPLFALKLWSYWLMTDGAAGDSAGYEIKVIGR